MSKIYLLNVGANTGHQSRVRSPLFNDGSFRFVSIPEPKTGRPYPAEALPFVRGVRSTHLDPDWAGLTYGDYCHNPRARALRNVVENDVLLFWALLWGNKGDTWSNFIRPRARHWCLIGALRVREILRPGQRAEEAKTASRVVRAKENMHFSYGDKLLPDHYVFIGCSKHSTRFQRPVDLQVRDKTGLLCSTIHSKDGDRFEPKGKPKWSSSLRSCRVVWKLDVPEERRRAEKVRDAISDLNKYDMLAGL